MDLFMNMIKGLYSIRQIRQENLFRTGPLEIGSGDKVAQINQILSDEETTNLPAIT